MRSPAHSSGKPAARTLKNLVMADLLEFETAFRWFRANVVQNRAGRTWQLRQALRRFSDRQITTRVPAMAL
jgi:hypothetical protein